MLTKTEVLLTLQRNIEKEHIELDLSGRVSKIYAALDDAVTGDVCLVKEFVYYGASLNVRGRAEGYGVWDSAFDQPVLPPENLTDDMMNDLTDDMGAQLQELA